MDEKFCNSLSVLIIEIPEKICPTKFVLEIEFTEFIRYSNKSPKKRNLNPSKIKLIGVEASGRDFDMDIDIASMSFSK